MKRAELFIILLICIVVCIAGINFLILKQENILRKYFIIDPQERMKEYNASLSSSLSKYFIRENKASSLNQVIDYIKRYGKTSLYELSFIFKDKDGAIKQISKLGITTVTKEALASESVYPVAVDNGRTEGYLMVIIRETGEAEFKEGLKKYYMISYSLRFLFLLLVAALSIIVLYHNYSAKMKLARDLAEIKASNDGLTGLHTHEYFKKILEIEVEKFKIYHTPLAILMLDIDNFKGFNDKFGHLAGDRIIQEVAKLIRSNTRATDILARYGGEEFAVIVPYVIRPGEMLDAKRLENFMTEVKNVADRIRKNVEDSSIEFLSNIIEVTISIGIVFYGKRAENITSAALLQKADKALYKAKSLGKNRMYVDSDFSKVPT